MTYSSIVPGRWDWRLSKNGTIERMGCKRSILCNFCELVNRNTKKYGWRDSKYTVCLARQCLYVTDQMINFDSAVKNRLIRYPEAILRGSPSWQPYPSKSGIFSKTWFCKACVGIWPTPSVIRTLKIMLTERGFSVDHSTINRWALHYSPQLEVAFRRKK